MTTIYFIRHAESDHNVHDDFSRPLTLKGAEDSEKIAALLRDIPFQAVYSSPLRRAMDTVAPLAAEKGLPVIEVEELRERRISGQWIEDFREFSRLQWLDFDYRLPGGESLGEVEARNAAALETLLSRHKGQYLAVGTHGTALSVLLHRYTGAFGWEDFLRVKNMLPWLVRVEFNATEYLGHTEIPFAPFKENT